MRLIVSAGATAPPGIGLVYKIAIFGIVSEKARKYGVSDDCDKVIYVPGRCNEHRKNWRVVNKEEESYSLRPLVKRGSLHVFKGGNVPLSETKEAIEKDCKVHFYPEFGIKNSEESNPVHDFYCGLSTEKQ